MGTPVTRKFFHDGVDVIADYDASDALKSRHITPFLDGNVMMTIPSDDDYFYFQDGLGSVRQVVDSSSVRLTQPISK
jgi:hypothetical protein